jgi:hypothetical protein
MKRFSNLGPMSWGIAGSSVTAFVFVSVMFLGIPKEHANAQPTCWILGKRYCSICGLAGTSCVNTLCVGSAIFGFNCPAGASEQQRQYPATNFVAGCETASSGSAGCSTIGGQTFWCTQQYPCGASNCRRDPTRGNQRYCSAPAGGPVGNVCGVTVAHLTGGSCAVASHTSPIQGIFDKICLLCSPRQMVVACHKLD